MGSTGAFRLPSRPWRPWRPQLVSVSKLNNGSQFLHSFAGTLPESAAVELGRLQLGPATIVCVLEESLDGEMRVLKVTGIDASGDRSHENSASPTQTGIEPPRSRGKDTKHKRRDDAAPTSSPLPPGWTAWYLAMEGPAQLKAWMAALKRIVADLRQTESVRSAASSARLEQLRMVGSGRPAQIEEEYRSQSYADPTLYRETSTAPSRATYSLRSAGSEGSRGVGDGVSMASDRRRLRRPSYTNPLASRHDVATQMSATAPRNLGLVTNEELDVLAGLSRALDQGLAAQHSPTTGADSDGRAGSMSVLADGPSRRQPGSFYRTPQRSPGMASETDRVPPPPTSSAPRRLEQRPLPALPVVAPSSPRPKTPRASHTSPTQAAREPLGRPSLSSSTASAESGVLGDYWRDEPTSPGSSRRRGDVSRLVARRGDRRADVDDVWAESQEDLRSAEAEAAAATFELAELARQRATTARTGGRIRFLSPVGH